MFVNCNVFFLLVVACCNVWLQFEMVDWFSWRKHLQSEPGSLSSKLSVLQSLSLFVCPFIFLSWSQLLSSVFLFSLFIPSFYNLSLFVCSFSLFSLSLFVFQHSLDYLFVNFLSFHFSFFLFSLCLFVCLFVHSYFFFGHS